MTASFLFFVARKRRGEREEKSDKNERTGQSLACACARARVHFKKKLVTQQMSLSPYEQKLMETRAAFKRTLAALDTRLRDGLFKTRESAEAVWERYDLMRRLKLLESPDRVCHCCGDELQRRRACSQCGLEPVCTRCWVEDADSCVNCLDDDA